MIKPFLREENIKGIEDAFLCLNKKDINVLEWGAGYSTKYFPDFLVKQGIVYNWLALEYNQKWYNIVKKFEIPNVQLELFLEVKWQREFATKAPMNEYVDFPATLGSKFDIIIVDGRKRRRCLMESLKLLKPNGIVLLDDAQRSYYECALKYFDGKFITGTLWQGKLKHGNDNK